MKHWHKLEVGCRSRNCRRVTVTLIKLYSLTPLHASDYWNINYTYRPRLDDTHFSASCFLSDTVRLFASPVVPVTNINTRHSITVSFQSFNNDYMNALVNIQITNTYKSTRRQRRRRAITIQVNRSIKIQYAVAYTLSQKCIIFELCTTQFKNNTFLT